MTYQEEAIWSVLALAENPAFHFSHTLQPGDIEWVHNPSILHSREPYTDGEVRPGSLYGQQSPPTWGGD